MDTCTPEEAGFSSERLKRVDTMAQRYVDEGKLAGLVTLVARHGRVVHVGKCGVQDLEMALPMKLDTIFRIYSMTKPITTVALMMLYEHGLFQLRDQVDNKFRIEMDNALGRNDWIGDFFVLKGVNSASHIN